MMIEQLWQELEAEAGADALWLTRFASPKPGYPLLVAIEPATRTRSLLLPVSRAVLPPRREWPECRGLELLAVAIGEQPHLCVRLRDHACKDVFTALAGDVLPRVTAAGGPKEAATALLDRLRHWQQFLSIAREGLSLEAERGLWGELHFLRFHLLPALGAKVTVGAWKAGAAAHQDFQFSAGSVEVKTTAAKQPQAVRITSERQLDEAGVGELLLHVVIVDEREVTPAGKGAGQSLPALVSEVRTQIGDDVVTLAGFNDCLLNAGWLDAHSPRYESRRRAIRNEYTFHVRAGFPRLVEADLPSGVGDVNYALSLAACMQFAISEADVLSKLVHDNTKKKSRKRRRV